MQTMICYYYPNSVDVQLNVDPTLTLRNRVVYMRSLKLYKGIDNIVKFTFKNGDHQPVNVTGWDINFNIISDSEGSIVVSQGVTPVNANLGVVTTTISDLDTIDLNNRFYNYSISLTDPTTGIQQVAYADENYGVRGEIELLSGHYPTFRPSINVSLPTTSNTNVITSTVVSDTPTRQQSAHHTAQYYFDTFTGTVEIQATLDSLPANGNTGGNTSLSWATISSTTFSEQIKTVYQNFDGVYTAVRFIVTPEPAPVFPIVDSGTVTKILYRA